MRAILLINDNGVGDVNHHNVLECHITSLARWRCRPCLDPNSVISSVNGAVLNLNSPHFLLVLSIPQAPYTAPNKVGVDKENRNQ